MKKYGSYLVVFVVVFSFFRVLGYAEDKDILSYIGKGRKECALCGEGKGSLKSIYSGLEGVALLCLNDWRVIRIFEPEEGKGGDIVYQRGGDGAYNIQINHVVDSRISLVEYTSEKRDVPDKKHLSDILCGDCLEKVKEAVTILGDHEGRLEKAVCLLDFSTMELHSIQQNFQYYVLEDYYVQAQCKKKKIRLTVFKV